MDIYELLLMMYRADAIKEEHTVLVKEHSNHDPLMLIGTCFGKYPALVLSRLRESNGMQPESKCVDINGVYMEAYERYCLGAKEVKVSTPKLFSIDNGKNWMTAEDFYNLSFN